jgi:hypothetical protein
MLAVPTHVLIAVFSTLLSPTSDFVYPNSVFVCATVMAIGVIAEAVLFPMMEFAARFAIFASETELFAIVKAPVFAMVASPDMATSVATPPALPTKICADVKDDEANPVCVWSP